jgi:exonuclease VII small subunit
VKRERALAAIDEAAFEEVKHLFMVFAQGLESPESAHDRHLEYFQNGLKLTQSAHARAVQAVTALFEE